LGIQKVYYLPANNNESENTPMPSTKTIQSYPCKPKNFTLVLCVVFFGIAAWFFAHLAQTNDRGLTVSLVRNVVELSFTPNEATVFYWALCASSLSLVLLGFLGLYKAFFSNGQIVLTNEGITAPAGIFSRHQTVHVSYHDIRSIELQTVHRVRFITIIHESGKLHINDSMLPQKNMFDDIVNTITNHFHPQ
jgi:hypothetical protein